MSGSLELSGVLGKAIEIAVTTEADCDKPGEGCILCFQVRQSGLIPSENSGKVCCLFFTGFSL